MCVESNQNLRDIRRLTQWRGKMFHAEGIAVCRVVRHNYGKRLLLVAERAGLHPGVFFGGAAQLAAPVPCIFAAMNASRSDFLYRTALPIFTNGITTRFVQRQTASVAVGTLMHLDACSGVSKSCIPCLHLRPALQRIACGMETYFYGTEWKIALTAMTSNLHPDAVCIFRAVARLAEKYYCFIRFFA